MLESKDFYNKHNIQEDFIIEAIESKSRSVMTLLAITIAAALLILGKILSLYNYNRDNNFFILIIIIGAIISFLTAIICFIVSADSLDTLYNRFLKDEDIKIKQYFYERAFNRKYYGFVLFITGIILFIAKYNIIISCMLIGFTLSIGYTIWFPNIEHQRKLRIQAITLGIIMVGFPIVWFMLYKK